MRKEKGIATSATAAVKSAPPVLVSGMIKPLQTY